MSGDVPTIDVSGLWSNDVARRRAVAAELGAACERIGFIVLRNHQVPKAVLDDVFQSGLDFFDLPAEEKRRFISESGGAYRGYTPLASEALAQTLEEKRGGPDLYEAFTVGRMAVPDDAYHRAHAHDYFAPNLWPERPERFAALTRAYYEAMEQLAGKLMRGFALALDLDETFFDDKFDKHISNMRFINYPAQATAPGQNQIRCGAHTDYGSLTIVYSRAADGGLQVQNADGVWSDVELDGDSFVVNIGDLLSEWTNDRWVSTMHRVANPSRPGAGNRRQSIAFFHQPNYDAVIECIPTCTGEDNPPRYAPVLSGDHLAMKVARQAY